MAVAKRQVHGNDMKELNKNQFLGDFISPKKVIAVPNHLLDTKIFQKLKQNASTKIDPSIVHFEGFKLNTTFKQTIKICNASAERQNLHIVPPSTKYFSILYTKPRRFVAGFTIDVTIKFTADEWRYYYDCIRVHCKGDENLIIPLHAYPVMDTSEFSKKLVFPTKSVILGETQTQTLPLKSACPVDFEFQLTVAQSHPAFTVHPLSGVVPGEGETAIVVTFTPKEYATAHMTMLLNVSQFNAQPLSCHVTASCSPQNAIAMHRSIKDLDEMFKETKLLDPRLLRPIQIARKRRRARPKSETGKEIEKDGLFFSVNIDNQHAVNNVLNQKAGKLRVKDMQKSYQINLQDKQSSESVKSTTSRQMKDAAFKQLVRQDQMEERANQLRWQVKRGYSPLSEEDQIKIIMERDIAMEEYKHKNLKIPVHFDEVARKRHERSFRRTFRMAHHVPEITPGFDLYRNNPWLVRHRALARFQQAARTVLIRNRADHKVRMLQQMIKDFKSGLINIDKPIKSSSLDVKMSQHSLHADSEALLSDINLGSVKPFRFPVYVEMESKDDITADKLDSVEFGETSIEIQHNVPFQNLKVPHQFKLMGYGDIDIHESSKDYVHPGLAKLLRTGADDEIIHVSVPMHLLDGEEDSKLLSSQTDRSSGKSSVTSNKEDIEGSSGVVMPSGLLQNPVYHPLHIFNPVPGLQQHHLPFTQSEIDSDYHLCPIPRYTHLPGATHFLEDDDVIKGIMTWKSFPSQASVVVSQIPVISDTALPRWSDPFCEALLPIVTPDLLHDLPEDDKANLLENTAEMSSEYDVIELTPEMVNAQFPVKDQLLSVLDNLVTGKQMSSVVNLEKRKHDTLGVNMKDTLKKLESMDKDKPKITLW